LLPGRGTILERRAKLNVDLHVHTNVSSPCSFIEPERMIRRAIDVGLDAVCVTEHEEIEGAEVARRLGAGYPEIKVFRGIEIYTEFGDMLVYGLYRDAPGWKTPFADLLEMCEDAGAAIVIAHPCRIAGELEQVHGEKRVREMLGYLTAVETHNGGSTPGGNDAALQLARSGGLPGTGGSDAHHEFQVGRCFTVFDDEINTDEELVVALKRGRYHGVYQ
jgi:predicted metal-dependent phosphoesterase TrpH